MLTDFICLIWMNWRSPLSFPHENNFSWEDTIYYERCYFKSISKNNENVTIIIKTDTSSRLVILLLSYQKEQNIWLFSKKVNAIFVYVDHKLMWFWIIWISLLGAYSIRLEKTLEKSGLSCLLNHLHLCAVNRRGAPSISHR